jgi:hypothetical protein
MLTRRKSYVIEIEEVGITVTVYAISFRMVVAL